MSEIDLSKHFVFDTDELVEHMRWREREEGWTKETCQHRAFRLLKPPNRKLYFCCHCGKRVPGDKIWKPPVTGSGSPFVDLETP